MWAGVNSYFLANLPDADQKYVLSALQQAGITVVRVFVTQFKPNGKKTNAYGQPGLEMTTIGQYNDTALIYLDGLLSIVPDYGIKLIITFHDRWNLDSTYQVCDAYCLTYSKSKTDPPKYDPAQFYTNKDAQQAFDNRVVHIINHQNAKMGNVAWKDLSQLIYAFEFQNEAMGAITPTLPNPDWWCTRATNLRPLLPNNGIKIATGGGRDFEQSIIDQNFNCSAIDIVAIHAYDFPVDFVKVAITKAIKSNKMIVFEEFGALEPENRESTLSFVAGFANAHRIPWMPWEVSSVTQTDDFEFSPADTSLWNVLTKYGKAAGGSVAPVPVTYSVDSVTSFISSTSGAVATTISMIPETTIGDVWTSSATEVTSTFPASTVTTKPTSIAVTTISSETQTSFIVTNFAYSSTFTHVSTSTSFETYTASSSVQKTTSSATQTQSSSSTVISSTSNLILPTSKPSAAKSQSLIMVVSNQPTLFGTVDATEMANSLTVVSFTIVPGVPKTVSPPPLLTKPSASGLNEVLLSVGYQGYKLTSGQIQNVSLLIGHTAIVQDPTDGSIAVFYTLPNTIQSIEYSFNLTQDSSGLTIGISTKDQLLAIVSCLVQVVGRRDGEGQLSVVMGVASVAASIGQTVVSTLSTGSTYSSASTGGGVSSTLSSIASNPTSSIISSVTLVSTAVSVTSSAIITKASAVTSSGQSSSIAVSTASVIQGTEGLAKENMKTIIIPTTVTTAATTTAIKTNTQTVAKPIPQIAISGATRALSLLPQVFAVIIALIH